MAASLKMPPVDRLSYYPMVRLIIWEMELPEQGVFFRNSPSGWTFWHSVLLWACATAATFSFYFVFAPLQLEQSPPWAFAGLGASAVLLLLAFKAPSRTVAWRVMRALLLYCAGLVGIQTAGIRMAALPPEPVWMAAMIGPSGVILLWESITAWRCRKNAYAVGLYPDRFEYEQPGALKSWPWRSLSVFWDRRAREFVVTGPHDEEVRLRRDLPRRKRIVQVIEAKSGRRCKELI
jgi:hypothetical protein